MENTTKDSSPLQSQPLFTFELPSFDFLIKNLELSKTELEVIATAFSDPNVRKYLSVVAANQVREFANISLDNLVENQQLVILRQAYLKGGLGMLQTLLSIERPQPTSVPATQQG